MADNKSSGLMNLVVGIATAFTTIYSFGANLLAKAGIGAATEGMAATRTVQTIEKSTANLVGGSGGKGVEEINIAGKSTAQQAPKAAPQANYSNGSAAQNGKYNYTHTVGNYESEEYVESNTSNANASNEAQLAANAQTDESVEAAKKNGTVSNMKKVGTYVSHTINWVQSASGLDDAIKSGKGEQAIFALNYFVSSTRGFSQLGGLGTNTAAGMAMMMAGGNKGAGGGKAV